MTSKYKRELIKNRTKENNYPERLYHYTSIGAFYSIIKSHEFWLGSAASMNDNKEVKVFLEEMEKVLMEDLDQGYHEVCKKFFLKVYTRLKDEYPYLMSLSELEDDAGQWERYADNAKGIQMALNTENVMLLFGRPDTIVNKVFYDWNVRGHDHYKTILKYLTTGHQEEFSNEEGLIDNFLACGYIRKHKSFSGENEVRIATLWDSLPKGARLKTEYINGQIKRYMKVDMDALCKKYELKFEDLFEEILIGPRSSQNANDLQSFLKEEGLYELSQKIKLSECPLR